MFPLQLPMGVLEVGQLLDQGRALLGRCDQPRLGPDPPQFGLGNAELEPELDVHCEADEPGLHQLNRGGFHLDETLGVWERRYIKAALRLSKGNLSEAARMLGLNRTTLYSRIQRLSGRSV